MPIKDPSDEQFSRLFDKTRRLTKRFRPFPDIVVQPPEAEMDTTSSMPDLHSFLKKDALKKPLFNKINETNCSCPDLRDETYYENRQFDSNSVASEEMEDVFGDYDDFSENVSICSENYHDSDPDSYKSSDSRYFSEFSPSKYRFGQKMLRRRRKEEQPTEVLRKNLKYKHSTSLYNLPDRRKPDTEPGYDSYYTVHGENNLTHHSPSPYTNPSFDFHSVNNPKHGTFRTNNNYGSMDRIRGFHHSHELSSYHPENSFYTRSISSPHGNLNQTHNYFNTVRETEIKYKCCCGGVNCKKVVPINDYLETYFVKTVRFFICYQIRLSRMIML